VFRIVGIDGESDRDRSDPPILKTKRRILRPTPRPSLMAFSSDPGVRNPVPELMINTLFVPSSASPNRRTVSRSLWEESDQGGALHRILGHGRDSASTFFFVEDGRRTAIVRDGNTSMEACVSLLILAVFLLTSSIV